MRNLQIKSHSVFNEYEHLQEKIEAFTGVKCSVLCKPEYVSIRTENYADFYLAKSTIKGCVSLPIVRDEQDLPTAIRGQI